MDPKIDPQILELGDAQARVDDRIQAMTAADFADRFWAKDATLWGGDEERRKNVAAFLGWIDAAAYFADKVDEIEAFVAEVKSAGFERVILAGMGGSSLAPLVFSQVPASGDGLPLHVLDLTDPATVLQIERAAPLDKTLVIVASKSGSTAEPTAFNAYLWDKVGKPANFVAITDPGSPFHQHAEANGYRKIFLNLPDIGGRYSALSFFGLVPAALLGHDVRTMLAAANALIGANRSPSDPAFALGAALGELAVAGRDKLTFFTPTGYEALGLWMEQLVAESTGKEGKGILPVALEEPGLPTVYGSDRVFVQFAVAGKPTADLSQLKAAGHPVVTIEMDGIESVAQEMMRFEIATAVAGTVLDINPFDQPNVQESKDITKRLLNQVEAEGSLPEQKVGLREAGLRIYGATCADTIAESISSFLGERRPGDYIALQAFIAESPATDAELRKLQRFLRDATGLAVTLGYGPRFLHSTGQYHKGGPNRGFFLQLTSDHAEDAAIPGQKATWAQFVDAQAMGDLEALGAKGARTLRIHLGADTAAGVATLTSKIKL
jgi:glucose-6-phosphate isomerase